MITLIDAVVDDILLKRNLTNISPEKREIYKKRLGAMLEQRIHIAFLDSLTDSEWKEFGIEEGTPLSFEHVVKAMEDPLRITILNQVINEFIDEFGQPPIMEVDRDLPRQMLNDE